MEKSTSVTARIFAILFSILFVLTTVMTILMVNFQDLAFNPEIYKNALASTQVYERLPLLIGEQIVYTVNKNPCINNQAACSEEQIASTPAYLSSVDAAEWAVILSKLVDPRWLKAQLESVIDQIFTTLNTPGQPLSLDVSLVELKARLGGEDGYQAALALLNSLEPCAIPDLLNLPEVLANIDSPAGMPLCRPSETVLKLGEDAIRTTLKGLSDLLPDNTRSITNSPVLGGDNTLVYLQRMLQLIRTAAAISLAIPVFLLLVITLLVVRNLKGFLNWWGVPLIIAGALTLLVTFIIAPALQSFILVRVSSQAIAPALLDLIKDVVQKLTESYRNTLAIQAGILCLFGILMLIAARLIRPKSSFTPL